MTNIVSLSKAIKRGDHVFFDSELENAFIVTLEDRVVSKYACNNRGLYVRVLHERLVNFTTVEEYIQRQILRVTKVRKFYHDLCAENEWNVKFWLRSNQAKNIPVSVEDMNLAKGIFWADGASCKGKSTRSHPPVVHKNDIVELPPELRVQGMQLELAMDVFYCNDQSFLHAVDQSILYNGLTILGTRKKGENYTVEMLCEGLYTILAFYNRVNVYISMIHCDHKFKKLEKELCEKLQGIEFNYALPQEHVPDIEHKN